MSKITITITFYTPFRVGSGSAGEGLDVTLNHDEPLPEAHVKGLMRAAARRFLPGTEHNGNFTDHALVREVFGARTESPWHWDPVVWKDKVSLSYETDIRIALDERRRTRRGSLQIAEQVRAESATMDIWLAGSLDKERIDIHVALLSLAASMVQDIGAQRARELGWVGITTEPELSKGGLKLLADEVARQEESS